MAKSDLSRLQIFDPGGVPITHFRGIYPCLDYFKCKINNISLRQVFRLFGLQQYLSDNFMAIIQARSTCYIQGINYFEISCMGMKLRVPTFFVYQIYRDDLIYDPSNPLPEREQFRRAYDLFDFRFEIIQVELSGQGLRNFRSFGLKIDELLLSGMDKLLDKETQKIHVTRVDVAFDFIDIYPEYLDTLMKHLRENGNPVTGKIGLLRGAACNYQIWDIGSKGVALGNRGSGKYLRVYDKLLEVNNKGTASYYPYTQIDVDPIHSWIRFEIELKREFADTFCFGNTNDSLEHRFYGALLMCRDHFMIVDKMNTFGHASSLVWCSLLPWNDLNQFVHIFYFVSLRDLHVILPSVIDRAEPDTFAWVANYGLLEYLKKLRHDFAQFQTNKNPYYQSRFDKFQDRAWKLAHDDGKNDPEFIQGDDFGFFKLAQLDEVIDFLEG